MSRSLTFIAVALAVGIAGCGLFEARNPEKPTSSLVPCPTRSAVDSVEVIVHQSYGSVAGVTCYTDALDAAFEFHPDPTDSLESVPSDPDIFKNWNRDVEARVASNLAADAQFASAVFDSEYASPDIPPGSRTETHYYAYHVNFQAKSGGAVERYHGLATVTYEKGSDELWRIAVWVDQRDASGPPTWGLLRRGYRTGF